MKRRKCFREVTGFDDKYVLIVGIPLSGIIVSMMLFNDYYARGDWAFLSVCIPISFVYTCAFWFSMRWVYVQIKSLYPSLDQLGQRLMVMAGALLVNFLVINFVLDQVFQSLAPGHKKPESVILEFLATFLITSLMIAIYEAISFYILLQVAMAEKSDLERRHIQSQLEGLRNQVNPHFLFNSLNTLVYLIPENSEKAVNFVQKLSKVYRYVLESRDASVISIREEMDYLNAYVFLLRERFGDNLKVELADLNGLSNAKIVPLTLQILFENAIKHNIISSEKPLKIEIFPQNNQLIIRNNLQLKSQVMDSTGVGLENIRERYRLLTQQEIQVSTTPPFFTVSIPLSDI